ncbi:hypothetical protein L9Z73_05920, partial [Pseudomonas sp. TNT11]
MKAPRVTLDQWRTLQAVVDHGGFTPAISTWFIHITDDKASPAYWLMFAALCALCSTLALYYR